MNIFFNLNPFPSLFVYNLFAATILRIAVAIVFVYIAQYMYEHRAEISNVRFPIIGTPKRWMLLLSAGVTLLTAFFLFVGLDTQCAAIVGIVIAIKHAFIPKQFASLTPFGRSTYILLVVICISLMLLGGGRLAFDYPML